MKLSRLLLFVVAISFNVLAMPKTEIEHLLNYVSSTHCQYERNGDMHSGQEAVEHIKKKYDYYDEEIETAEDFIEYSATKSTLTGAPYKIHCEGQAPTTSRVWLLAELARYRKSRD